MRLRKRAQTTHLALFGPLVRFFLKNLLCFIVTNDCIRYYLSTEGLGKAAATKTGPNDAKCIVWAIRKLFFFSFVFYGC